jgi:hypothetical protein
MSRAIAKYDRNRQNLPKNYDSVFPYKAKILIQNHNFFVKILNFSISNKKIPFLDTWNPLSFTFKEKHQIILGQYNKISANVIGAEKGGFLPAS